jgi:hypothetical protein
MNRGIRRSRHYAIDDGERLLLFDPIAVPRQIEELAPSRETAIVLTAPWHERDTQALVERLGVPVFAPPPESEEDLVQKYRITRQQAGDGSPDLAWLRTGDVGVAHWYSAGDRPLAGVEAFPSRETNEVVLWVEDTRAVRIGVGVARSRRPGRLRPVRAGAPARVPGPRRRVGAA